VISRRCQLASATTQSSQIVQSKGTNNRSCGISNYWKMDCAVGSNNAKHVERVSASSDDSTYLSLYKILDRFTMAGFRHTKLWLTTDLGPEDNKIIEHLPCLIIPFVESSPKGRV
jgi:hypothetical protein